MDMKSEELDFGFILTRHKIMNLHVHAISFLSIYFYYMHVRRSMMLSDSIQLSLLLPRTLSLSQRVSSTNEVLVRP